MKIGPYSKAKLHTLQFDSGFFVSTQLPLHYDVILIQSLLVLSNPIIQMGPVKDQRSQTLTYFRRLR